jgi:hypothetical protein
MGHSSNHHGESSEDAEANASSSAGAADASDDSGSASRRFATAEPLERLLRWAGASVAAGVRESATRTQRLDSEPLEYGAEVDWLRALDISMRRRDSERARLDRIEGKIAPIIAGTLAALALFVDKAGSTMDDFLAALLLVPLAMLFRAFGTYEYIDTPSLDELVRTYERWPLTYVRSVVIGTADAVARNGPSIDRKARSLNHTMGVLFTVIVIIIASRACEAFQAKAVHHGAISSPRPAVLGLIWLVRVF